MELFIYVTIGLAVAFVLVVWNNKNNRKKLSSRKNRNFRQNYEQKKEKVKK
ncbi:hypothetical protein ACF3OE_05070 [Capnocytophaga canis]|uniref:hypothetical protein n=1 Tax=Capnocytophaga TaxID=1016 RepID=UPI0018E35F76|nr:hypothetical protein [Capnocytophaga sp. H4358]